MDVQLFAFSLSFQLLFSLALLLLLHCELHVSILLSLSFCHESTLYHPLFLCTLNILSLPLFAFSFLEALLLLLVFRAHSLEFLDCFLSLTVLRGLTPLCSSPQFTLLFGFG